MNTPSLHTTGSLPLPVERQRVLRNTYGLLALSLLPTVAGAWLGIQANFSLLAGSPFLGFVVFLAIAFGFFWGIERTKHSGWGVALLLGFTFFMGLMLSGLLRVALGLANGGQLIALAGGGTAAVMFVMAAVATTSKRDFSNMGKFLFVALIALLVAVVANLFLQIPALALTISTLAIVLFSAFLLYDLSRIVNGGETNYISATLAVYLSLYNIFANLLSLLMAFTGERE
ncbi:MAG TPA: Bax inhibitor-1/YccA family protein [Burkholderiaceae bacterium]|jgi:modulator of FtsH protease|nr:Bax inhibitor-1/YccA family protein [Burkholderiaceae bacterium]